MNITLDYPTKTLTVNNDVKANELADFIERNAMWEWTITWKK
jgi:hypothetical protein